MLSRSFWEGTANSETVLRIMGRASGIIGSPAAIIRLCDVSMMIRSKGVPEMPRPSPGQDGDDIVSLGQRRVVRAARQPEIAGCADAVLRGERYGVDGGGSGTAGLHFDEHRQIALACNNVDFAERRLVADRQDTVALAEEI